MQSLNKIMYIEDDVDIQKVVKLSLEKIGKFNVVIYNSGQEALNAISTEKPDIILMDVMMPDMDGPATFEKIKSTPEFADIPVVFMTAKAQVQEVARYRELGVLDVIIKPFDPLTLAETIKKIWESRNAG
jgi:two-component system, OmpR family, response regulator